MRIGIKKSRLQDIAHGANAWGLSLGPSFKGDVKNNGDAVALRPAKLVIETNGGVFTHGV